MPTPSLAAAHAQALLLAQLRERPAPLRSDLLDARHQLPDQGEADVEGRLVRSVARDVLTGHRAGASRRASAHRRWCATPWSSCEALRLHTEGDEPRNLALDLYRNPAHRRTSRTLHGLRMLGVPFGTHVAGPDFVRGVGLTRLQERWTYLWTPATEARLVELSLLGSTLAETVRARFRQSVEDATLDGRLPTERAGRGAAGAGGGRRSARRGAAR